MTPDEIVNFCRVLRYCATDPNARECVLCDYDTQKPHCRDNMAATAADLIESLQSELAIYKGFPNEPLTLAELRGMVGEWVWVEHLESSASLAAPGEWLKIKLKPCDQNTIYPYIHFESKGLCAIYCDKSWRAYRRPPERSEDHES